MSEYYLGYFNGGEASGHNAGVESSGAVAEAVSGTGRTQHYYAHNFTNGTECELTGERRSTEVRFTCSPEATGHGFVESLNEHPTCHYVLHFASSLLCNHSAFSPKPPQARSKGPLIATRYSVRSALLSLVCCGPARLTALPARAAAGMSAGASDPVQSCRRDRA